jgi:hypothetical protein
VESRAGAIFLSHFMPSSLPSFFWRPDFVVGTPVALATFRFAWSIPRARFGLNDTPGIPFFFAIFSSFLQFLHEARRDDARGERDDGDADER